MFGRLISNILTISQQVYAGQIINGQLNPLHPAIATTGYRIQSRTLQIPDRLGFFSPGSPRLQAHDGWCFIFMLGWICLNLISNAFSVYVCSLYGLPTCQKLGAAYSLTLVPGVILFWIVAVYGRHRAPGYDWGDWKLRKD